MEWYKGVQEPATSQIWFYPIGDGNFECRVYGSKGWQPITIEGTSADGMIQKAVTDELALKVDKSTQGMKLLADYTINTNIVFPQVQSIDYATSTVTFKAPHGFTVLPAFYAHTCCAYINDYRIKTNYKAVPSGLQVDAGFKIVEMI